MPNPKIYVGKINSTEPVKETLLKQSANKSIAPVQVQLEDGENANIDMNNARASVWANTLDYLQENNRPVYAELDDETNAINKLYIPIAAKVLDISSEEENMQVGFNTSQAIHTLKRDHPSFEQFMEILQSSKDTGAEVMATSTNHDFEIVDVRALPKSFGIEASPEQEAEEKAVEDKPITPARAKQLFDLMKAQNCIPCGSKSPCIPFKYAYDGCWIRAHLMCYLLIAQGETPSKMWIGYGSLRVRTNNVPQCSVGWAWHVAATLPVIQPNGTVAAMIIDPSVCDEPVTPDAWRDLQRKTATLTPAAWPGYNYLAVGSATQAQAETDMQEYRLRLDDLCAEYGPPPYKC